MRLKSVPICAAFAWSPLKLSSNGRKQRIVTASYSGAVNEDFSNDAFLSLYEVDVTSTDETEMPLRGQVRLPEQALRVDWSSHGGPEGIIAVAYASGTVHLLDAHRIHSGGDLNQSVLWTIREHQCPVYACQFNPSQPDCVAIGADDGKWFVWSIPSQSGGEPKKVAVIKNSTQSAGIRAIEWHPKFPHIIATSVADGNVRVWNLKTMSLLSTLVVSKYGKEVTANALAWNPNAATTLATGLSDESPLILVWDLRKPAAPEKELKKHQRGVTGLSWGMDEASILASCSGDGETLLWDPKTNELLGELERESDYIIDVQWCPTQPAVLATSSFAPALYVSSITGLSSGKEAGGGAAPKWLKRPCGASVNTALQVVYQPEGAPGLQIHSIAPRRPLLESSLPTASVYRFREEMESLPPGSPERSEWLQRHNFGLLAALTASSSSQSRQPIIDYLSEANASNEPRGHVNSDDPFEQLQQENQKSVEERTSELVASGRIEEAVDVCLEANRYEDAYAIAILNGELIPKVHKQYVEHTIRHNPKRRHVLFSGAITSGEYVGLLQVSVPWREVLSVVVTYVGEDFPAVCNTLGDFLLEEGELEGALAFFICSRDVDRATEVWARQNMSTVDLVTHCFLLEETARKNVTHPAFINALKHFGELLIRDGYYREATDLWIRSAEGGNTEAAQLVDRYRYVLSLNTNIQPDFAFDPIDDRPSPACVEYLDELQRQQQQHQQQQQQYQQQQPSPQYQQQQPPPQQPQQFQRPQQFPPQQPQPPSQQPYAPQPQQEDRRQLPPQQVLPSFRYQPGAPQSAPQRPPLLSGAPQPFSNAPTRQSSHPPTPPAQPPQYQPAAQGSSPPTPGGAPPHPSHVFSPPPPRLQPNPVSNYSSATRPPSNPNLPPPPRPGSRSSPMPPRSNEPSQPQGYNSTAPTPLPQSGGRAPVPGGPPPPPQQHQQYQQPPPPQQQQQQYQQPPPPQQQQQYQQPPPPQQQQQYQQPPPPQQQQQYQQPPPPQQQQQYQQPPPPQQQQQYQQPPPPQQQQQYQQPPPQSAHHVDTTRPNVAPPSLLRPPIGKSILPPRR